MRIPQQMIDKVKKIDEHYRETWDVRAIAHVTGVSAGSVSKILKESRKPKPVKKKPSHERRTKFSHCDVMWSTDFTEMSNGRKLVKTLDEKSDYKLGWDMAGSETADSLIRNLQGILSRMDRKPLVWKYDNGSSFKSKRFKQFLEGNRIMPYPIRRRAPWINGRTERDHQEVQKWMSSTPKTVLTDEEYEKELNEGIFMLNYIKPRAVLGFKTSASVYFNDSGVNDAVRETLFEEVRKMKEKDVKCKRNHRKAVREALKKMGLYEEYFSPKKEAESVNRS